MNLSDFYAFKKLATTQSFAKAARYLGVSRSAVTKRIRRLEQELGTVLVNRSTRAFSLTEAGKAFHAYTAGIDSRIERAYELVQFSHAEPRGTVSVAINSGLAGVAMTAVVRRLREEWPDLKVDAHVEDALPDIVAGGYDVAIQVTSRLDDSSLIARRIATTRWLLVASPAYIEAHGAPQSLADLSSHDCLNLHGPQPAPAIWRLVEEGAPLDLSVPARAGSDSLGLLVSLALGDAGILYVPEICIGAELADGRLVRVLESAADPEPIGVFAVYPHLDLPRKVQIFIDTLADVLHGATEQ